MEPKSHRTKPLRILSVTGGKGGVGKTTISVNLAIAFAKMKKKVLLFDADLGLANVDVMLGLRPQKTIHDVLSGYAELKDICLPGPYGMKIIPSASGIQKMADLTTTESAELIRSFSMLTDDIDLMFVDLAAGISSQVMNMTHASQDILLVICNDPSSLTDGYAVIKILNQNYSRNRFGIIVNKVKNSQEGLTVFTRFQEISSRFLNVSMHYLGHLPQDDFINIAAAERAAVVDVFPDSKAALGFKMICHAIDQWKSDTELSGGIQFFFERLVQSC